MKLLKDTIRFDTINTIRFVFREKKSVIPIRNFVALKSPQINKVKRDNLFSMYLWFKIFHEATENSRQMNNER